LGFEFDSQSYRPIESIVPKLKNFVTPIDKKCVQKFLGIVNYYRNHVAGLAHIAIPLYDLLKSGKKFNWTVEHETAFRNLKEKCAERLTLTPIQRDVPSNCTQMRAV
jgi:hypothetical protein